jgi:hypothetical protein
MTMLRPEGPLPDYGLDPPDEGLRVCDLHGSFDEEDGCPMCEMIAFRAARKLLRAAGIDTENLTYS